MQCRISCSFGEVVDKKTILDIKSIKIKEPKALKNILMELETIKKDVPLVNTPDYLFDELYKINYRLWSLEDLIREKSHSKSFDNKYIYYAELIHTTNDNRYEIKRQINAKYNSLLKEEKHHKFSNIKKDTSKIESAEIESAEIETGDYIILEKGKRLYTNGQYKKSYELINSIMKKYKDKTIINSFWVDLLFSYQNIVNIFNYKNEYYHMITDIMRNPDELPISVEQKQHIKQHYTAYSLHNKDYKMAARFINHINYIKGPNIDYNNMSFFSNTDINKTLLLYDGGGIGDKIMLSRFVPLLSDNYKNNYIIIVLPNNTIYLLTKILGHLKNVRLISLSNTSTIKHWDYHCNILSIIKYMNIEYNDITFTPLLKNVAFESKNIYLDNIIANIKKSHNKTFILNWKGNPNNPHEQHNRGMLLSNAIPLFQIENIDWIVITKDITDKDKSILNKYNVQYYGDILDVGGNSFEDSVNIIKNVDGLISTDTALVHLSANLNIQTYVLLTTGCEWRWTKNDTSTRWYPNSILIRQKTTGVWKDVIEELQQQLLI